jgi:hypothetical protein
MGVSCTTLVGVTVNSKVLVGQGVAVGVDVGVAGAMVGKAGFGVGRAARWARLMLSIITTPPMANNPSTSKPIWNRTISTKSLFLPVTTLLPYRGFRPFEATEMGLCVGVI